MSPDPTTRDSGLTTDVLRVSCVPCESKGGPFTQACARLSLARAVCTDFFGYSHLQLFPHPPLLRFGISSRRYIGGISFEVHCLKRAFWGISGLRLGHITGNEHKNTFVKCDHSEQRWVVPVPGPQTAGQGQGLPMLSILRLPPQRTWLCFLCFLVWTIAF